MEQSKDILNYLFESPVKVRALKLFLRNPQESFSLVEGAKRLRVSGRDLGRQVKKFLEIDLVRSRSVRVQKKAGKRGKTKTKTEISYLVNPHFAFYEELRSLVVKSSPTVWDKRVQALAKLGRVKLAVIAGHLVNDEKGRVDVLLVGDKLHPSSVAAFMRNLEADVGKELRYMTLSLDEFIYRYSMYDNFLRDVFERPHRKLINKMKHIVGD